MKRAISVFDKAAAAYMPPFFVPALGMAIRDFEDSISRADQNNPMHHHPSDFELWHLFDFDEVTGHVVPIDKPVCICTGAQIAASSV